MMNRKLTTLALAASATALLTLTACSASATDVSGTWGTPEGEGTPGLEIAKASGGTGTYQGTDGCNRVSGEYTLHDDGTITLEDMMSTRMYCEGVDTWLSNTPDLSAIVKDGKLVFVDDQLNEVGSLERQ
ncbi:META domain-containing protein [Leucobacter sp. cx-42]|uniref:META domain-containing protein n=1 Tax=unclassified Leucobacter TaxID=2621730 RepID=UPI00165DE36B|nr:MULTISPECIES: META domain-containing protein [unclassified Leucobacter]MBC9953127.1 META domain-containing protein [Leucobacter sp. cx-42]